MADKSSKTREEQFSARLGRGVVRMTYGRWSARCWQSVSPATATSPRPEAGYWGNTLENFCFAVQFLVEPFERIGNRFKCLIFDKSPRLQPFLQYDRGGLKPV